MGNGKSPSLTKPIRIYSAKQIFRFSDDTAASQHRHDTLVKAERYYLRSAGMVRLLVN
jgi:hypothetical protein